MSKVRLGAGKTFMGLSTRGPRKGMPRGRLICLIAALGCFAWSALWIVLGMNGLLDQFHFPDWVYTIFILVPLFAGACLLIVARILFRMTNYR